MNELLQNLWVNQRALMLSGLLFLILFLALAVISVFDSQQILGINRWMKPLKFSISIAVFLWTTAIYLYFVRGFDGFKSVIIWGTIITMVVEIVVIVGQASRGTTSHFNFKSGIDGILFGIMGAAIAVNTLMIIGLLILFVRAEIDLPQPIVWGMRLGIILFLAASIEGGYMVSNLAHSVGVADGGDGLPLVNWSTKGGDLRIAHFIGLHAMQAVPLFSLLLVWRQSRFAMTFTVLFAVIYFAAFSLTFLQALRGQPIISLSKPFVDSTDVATLSENPAFNLQVKNYDERKS